MENQPDQNPDTADQSPESTEASWNYTPSDQQDAPSIQPAIGSVTWTASEFIQHDKRAPWFLGLAGVALVAAALLYLMTNDLVTAVVIVIAAALFGVAAGRKPNTLEYRIDSKGIQIGPKQYPYAQFKSFSIIEEGAIGSIQLMPIGRFAPPISLYYPPDQEEEIINTLGSYLPHEDRKRDAVDRIMHKIRF